jgi:hypothetical protein
MTIAEEARAIQARLTQLFGKQAHEVILLGARLSCRNCNLSRFKGKVDGVPDVWYCTQWNANIPKEALGEGCTAWKNNVGVGHD